MTVASLARSVPSPAPTLAGDGVNLPLYGGESRELRFSSRNLLKIENVFNSFEEFFAELEQIPVNTLAWLLQACCEVKTLDAALDLLDGQPFRPLIDLVHVAFDRANPPTVADDAVEPQDPQ